MDSRAFFDKANSDASPKTVNGFSRPPYHNLMGLLHGHRYDKKRPGGIPRHTEAAMLFTAD